MDTVVIKTKKIKMTQVATPSDYQQPTINPNNGTDNTTTTNTKDSKIYIHTGNIANWTNVKSRRSNEMPTNELYQSLCRTITKHGSQQLGGWNEEEIRINCTNTEKIDSVERGLLKVTAKIFLQKLDTKSMVNSVNSTLKQLGLHSIDSLYLALPPFAENQPFAETILPLWEEMERFRDAGLATQISTCDLDHEKLKTLVEMVKIRPEVNQVNLTSCCHMPEDLVQYAKEIGIVLHTHGDQAVMLPDENVEALINVLKPDDDRTFSTDWIVRYAVVVKCRGVIKSKGYIAAIDALTNTE
ncbi:glutamate--cysteine ligase regulatory subunit-like isoform X2 [Clytia hemisphaerica]|uniref:GCS light chain n=1 Tax=Clytia hemisphaerica TaxID=252671 RepID=A0A7M5X6W6_9CNID